MRNISISDVTICQSGAGGFSLSFREKLELAKMLDKLGVSVIEAGRIENGRTDSLLIKSLSSAVKNSTLAVQVTLGDPESVELTWSCLREARAARLQVSAPVSTVQMEYLSHRKPAALLDDIRSTVSRCREKCDNVEFLAEDAMRSDEDFLCSAVNAAVEAGATLVTLCDAAGAQLPEETAAMVSRFRAQLPENVALGIRCANTLYMADSCAVSAIRAGADEVKVVSCGDATASLSNLTHIIMSREDCGVHTSVRTTELQRTVDQIRWMCETNRSKSSPFDNGVQENRSDVELTANDDVHAVVKAAELLGYDISEEDEARVYEAFMRIAAKKGSVGARELDAIIASAALQVPPVYKLENYVINSGHTISATCHIQLRKHDQLLESVCLGDGPVDASFLAIEQIVGRHFELDDFQIQAVTEGREAMGETVVRLRSGGKVYAGRGISTDVIGSSIRAYLSAVNKIAYEEGEA